MMKALDDNDQYSGFCFKSAFFDQDFVNQAMDRDIYVPRLLTNTIRSEVSERRKKCMVKPREVLEQGIHHVSSMYRADGVVPTVDQKVALLHHYSTCHGIDCAEKKKDRGLLRHTRHLRANIAIALKAARLSHQHIQKALKLQRLNA